MTHTFVGGIDGKKRVEDGETSEGVENGRPVDKVFVHGGRVLMFATPLDPSIVTLFSPR